MKHAPLILFLLISLLASNFNARAQKTIIYIVRHAEKVTGTANNDDPVLSSAGQERALALAKELKRAHIKAIYVTKYKRTGLTARPLAYQAKLLPRVYPDTNLKKFAATITKNFKGNNVLIIGHSNTVMPLLDAFGAEMPFETLDDEDYDMLFKVIIQENGDVELEITNYGQKHHLNDIPDKYLPEVVHPEYARPYY
ncbi:histidine phosphatase family protein [Inquilinus sp. KBS0705]|nr:histidine phosphatase family protein [Inquilinus sp. KBS0705]